MYDKTIFLNESLSEFNKFLNTIKTPNDLLTWMNKNIEYGYVSKSNSKITDMSSGIDFYNNYKLQTPNELFKSRLGVCWDQAEFQRYIFNNMRLENKVIYIVRNDPPDYPTHTFSIYKKGNSYWWFENSFEKYRGIHGSYKNLDEIIKKVNKSMDEFYNNKVDYHWCILPKPKYGIGVKEFMDFAAKYIGPIDESKLI
jgi:hypothetical protein